MVRKRQRGKQRNLYPNVPAKLESIDEDFIKKGAKGITDKDIQKVTDKADEIQHKFKKSGPLGRFVQDVELLISIVRDYRNKEYKKVPVWVIGAAVFTLLYVINPLDLVPDFIPFVGHLDDAAVVGICLLMIEQELQEYKKWKVAQLQIEADRIENDSQA
ncbi:MAG: DUF1232 domain-containing protein [candidate division Zixibacteria bacterium]|nr:DUF1232 domain-containing protein [candidate division Zixibacteria bacterium]